MARHKPVRQKPPVPPADRLESVFDDPPRKNVFLLTCIDQRLLDDTVRFMNALNLHNRYDQLALAGGGMGPLRLIPPKSAYSWRTMFLEHLQATIDKLHRPIKDVFIFEHLDCGAYKYLYPDDQMQSRYQKADLKEMACIHRDEMCEFATIVRDFIGKKRLAAEAEYDAAFAECKRSLDQHSDTSCWTHFEELAKEKAEAWKDIRVSYFVMDLLGNVTQLDVPKEQRDTLAGRSSNLSAECHSADSEE